MEEDIRRKGTLYFHQQRFGKRWKKVWCVLLAEGRRSVARLEVYEHKQSSIKTKSSTKHKPDYKQVIRLRECIRITDSEMADRPKDCGAFLLETPDKLYLFAAHLSEVKDWIRSLCEQAFPDVEAEQRLQRERRMCSEPGGRTPTEMQENSLYASAESVRDFLVIAVSTEAAVRCHLYGEYVLTPLVDCLVLKDVKTKEVLYKWPYCYVRKFGQDMLSFSFEAGRRCESGEGNFEFATHQGERLFNVVSAAIENLPKPSAAKPASLDHTQQSIDPEITDETYDDTMVIQGSDYLPDVKNQKAQHSKMHNPVSRSFSLDAIEPQMQSQVSNVNLENPEPVYATVSKPQPKATSSTDPKMNWQNLRKAVHQSPTFFKSDISQFDFPIPYADEVDEDTEDTEDLLGDSIQQLTINEGLQNIGEEAIYADPQDVDGKEEFCSGIYEDPEEVVQADGTEHQTEQDFYSYSSDMNGATTAPENTNLNPEMFSVYDNFRLKRS